MPAISFKKQFADKVLKGKKNQTIRPIRKNPIKKDDTLYLYTGMRTKDCKKLKEVKCKDVKKIKIDFFDTKIDGASVPNSSVVDLALNDGFDNSIDFIEFFEKQYGLPFEGVIIYW